MLFSDGGKVGITVAVGMGVNVSPGGNTISPEAVLVAVA